jgi:hypothetical protein
MPNLLVKPTLSYIDNLLVTVHTMRALNEMVSKGKPFIDDEAAKLAYQYRTEFANKTMPTVIAQPTSNEAIAMMISTFCEYALPITNEYVKNIQNGFQKNQQSLSINQNIPTNLSPTINQQEPTQNKP